MANKGTEEAIDPAGPKQPAKIRFSNTVLGKLPEREVRCVFSPKVAT